MKCIKCNKKAEFRYSPDLDIKGIGMCEEHKKEIQTDILISNFEGWDYFIKKYLK